VPLANDTVAPEKFGLAPAVVDRIHSVLAAFPAIEQVILYGSRAKGTHRPGSDIDLALVGQRMTEQQLSQLDSRLDDLLLPYTFDIAPLHAIRNPALLDHIRRVGVVFFPPPAAGKAPVQPHSR